MTVLTTNEMLVARDITASKLFTFTKVVSSLNCPPPTTS